MDLGQTPTYLGSGVVADLAEREKKIGRGGVTSRRRLFEQVHPVVMC